MRNIRVKRNVIQRRVVLLACYLGVAVTLFFAQAQAQGLKVEPLDGNFPCPWDNTLQCAKVSLQAGAGGSTFNVTSTEEGISIYTQDLQLQAWKSGRWIEFAPVLATYDSPDAKLYLHEDATWTIYVDISSALNSSKQEAYRVVVKDVAGSVYASAPIALTKKADETADRPRKAK